MSHEVKQTGGKEPYESPELVAIILRPEEPVLEPCAIAGSGGPISPSCASTNCLTLRSYVAFKEAWRQ